MAIRPPTMKKPRYCTCVKCGHSWWSKAGKPRQCPKCDTRNWDKPVEQYHHRCQVCLHEWASYTSRPRRCPKCFDYGWDQMGQPEEKENEYARPD